MNRKKSPIFTVGGLDLNLVYRVALSALAATKPGSEDHDAALRLVNAAHAARTETLHSRAEIAGTPEAFANLARFHALMSKNHQVLVSTAVGLAKTREGEDT